MFWRDHRKRPQKTYLRQKNNNKTAASYEKAKRANGAVKIDLLEKFWNVQLKFLGQSFISKKYEKYASIQKLDVQFLWKVAR